MVDCVDWNILGVSVPGGVGGRQIQLCCLCYRNEITDTRESYAYMESCLEKISTPCTAYISLVMERLIALNKQPGVNPVYILMWSTYF